MQSARFIPPRNISQPHGSSLRELGAPLDQERAASMADEGGMAGAVTDAVAQEAHSVQREASEVFVPAAPFAALQRLWPWALLLGAAALAAAAWRHGRQNGRAQW
jgi:hypothetical protein